MVNLIMKKALIKLNERFLKFTQKFSDFIAIYDSQLVNSYGPNLRAQKI